MRTQAYLRILMYLHRRVYIILTYLPNLIVGIGQDQKAMDEINYLWRELISNFKIGLIAILENGDEIGVDLPKVAGVNMCFPLVAGEKDVEVSVHFLRRYETVTECCEHENIWCQEFDILHMMEPPQDNNDYCYQRGN